MNGVLMIAIGKAHRAFAARSIQTLKQHWFAEDGCLLGPVRLVTDEYKFKREHGTCWPRVEFIEPLAPFTTFYAARREKTTAYRHAFEGVTLMVDADTTFHASPEELFQKPPETFALAVGPQPFIVSLKGRHPLVETKMREVGHYYPRFNSGVILFRRCIESDRLFSEWDHALRDLSRPGIPSPDEPALFLALNALGYFPEPLDPGWNACRDVKLRHHTAALKAYLGPAESNL
jgi:hypothetical protein